MGLLDVLNGMQNGPQGPQSTAATGGGMSKITMAILAFLAYKAFKGSSPPSSQGPASRSDEIDDNPGGLAGVLRTIFGGGAPSGAVVSKGLGNTVDELDRKGRGPIARSWIDRGPNQPISSQEVGEALGEEGIKELLERTGLSRGELLDALSEHLPRAIDRLTPEGRLPSREEAARL